MLKVGDTIKCANKEDLITTHNKLALNGVFTDFLYEKDGEQGLWLEVKSVKERMSMTENELKINGKSFGETISQIEEYMESDDVHGELFTILRSARDFMENLNEQIQQYRAIGTVDEFKALKEKSTPMKPIPNIPPEEGEVVCWTCPSCKKKHWNGYYFPPLTFDKVCTNCLQAIDWD